MQFIVKYGFFCLSGFFASFLVHLGGQKNPISTVQCISIGNGVTSIILPLVVIDDNIPEFGEVFILRLIRVELLDPPPYEAAAIMSPVLGYNTIAEIYIPQNDGPQGILQFSLGSLYVEESIGTFSVSVERVGGSFGPVSCRVELTGVPSSLPIATRDSDYVFQSVAFSWLAGELGSRNIGIEIIDDATPESREAIHIGISEILPDGVERGINATLTIVILGSDLGRGIFTIDPTSLRCQ